MTPAAELDLTTPRRTIGAFCEALNRGDLDLACAYFTREACLVTPDGTTVSGRRAIAGILGQLIDARARVSVQLAAVLAAGDVALAHEQWNIRSGVNGAAITRESKPTLVLQRVDSRWKLAIAAPWGWGG